MKLLGLCSVYEGKRVEWISLKGVLLSDGSLVPLSEVEKHYGKGQ